MHSTSKKIFLLPLGQFDIMNVNVNHNFVSFDSIQVYKIRKYSFKLTRHDEESLRWQIILGGWNGERSVIEKMNPDTLCLGKNHTKNDFDTLKTIRKIIDLDNLPPPPPTTDFSFKNKLQDK